MKRKLLSLCLILIIAFTVIGCNQNKSNADGSSISMYVGTGVFDSSLDPIKGAMSYGYSFTNCALIRVGAYSEYEGDLATSWEVSDDSLVYTFKLREGIKFHDGSDFTADDVVFTFETVKSNQGLNENVDLSRLKSVEAIDEYTVRFTLTEPESIFINYIAGLGIVPSDNYDSEKFDKYPIGTGAWKVAQYDTNQQIIVTAYEDYYEGAPEIKKVTFIKMDNEAAFSNAKSGQLDIVMVAPNYAKEDISGMTIKSLETMDIRNVSLPCIKEQTAKDSSGKEIKVGNNVTSDIAVRKALFLGIDRQKLIDNALNGIGKPAIGFTDNLTWGNYSSYDDNKKSEAKKILEEAGWIDSDGDGIREKDGLKCEFKLYTSSSDQQRYLLAVALAEDAKELGIKIEAKQATWDEIYEVCHSESVLWGWGQYNPIVLKSLLHSDMILKTESSNVVGYSNEKVDKLIDEAINSNNQGLANEKWKEAQLASEEDYPYLYLVNIEHCYFVNDKLDVSIDTQIPHPHGHGTPIICNMKDWKLNE